MRISEKYQKLRPFKKGRKYKVGRYIGKLSNNFVFATSDGMANLVSDVEEERIDDLLGKKALNFKPKTFWGWMKHLW